MTQDAEKIRNQRETPDHKKARKTSAAKRTISMDGRLNKQNEKAHKLPKAAVRAQELVAPEEWEGLLHNFENERGSRPGPELSIEAGHEDLWKRLSSARWIKTRRSPQAMPENDGA